MQRTERHFADDCETAAPWAVEPLEWGYRTGLRARSGGAKHVQIGDGSCSATTGGFTRDQSKELANQLTAHEALHVCLDLVHTMVCVVHYMRSPITSTCPSGVAPQRLGLGLSASRHAPAKPSP